MRGALLYTAVEFVTFVGLATGNPVVSHVATLYLLRRIGLCVSAMVATMIGSALRRLGKELLLTFAAFIAREM